jgi:hypothetical protein
MIRCYHCGTDNLDGSEYCDECGTKLAGASNPPAGQAIGTLRESYSPPGAFVTQMAPPPPPPPAFTKDTVTPKPATPYSPPPPPVQPMAHPPQPVSSDKKLADNKLADNKLADNNPADGKQVNQPGRGFPPPPPITSVAPSGSVAPPAPPVNRPVAPPGNLTAAFNGQTVGLAAGAGSGRSQAQNDGGDLQVRAKLIIQRGGKIGKEFPLAGSESMIGRWDADGGIFPDVDLDQDDPEAKVSRRHARIQFLNNQFLIEDLGSTNGTFINRGPRLLPGAKQPLNHGDEIIVGKTFLKFVLN